MKVIIKRLEEEYGINLKLLHATMLKGLVEYSI